MPIVTFTPDGQLRLPKAICERHRLAPETEVTLLAVPHSGWLVLLPLDAQLPPQLQQNENPVEDWRYARIIDEDRKITIPALLRAAMGWKKRVDLTINDDTFCVYIYQKQPAPSSPSRLRHPL